jgi:hypothetical protein
MNISRIDQEEWTILEELLSDENYQKAKNLVSIHFERYENVTAFDRRAKRGITVVNNRHVLSPPKPSVAPMTPGITPTLPPSEEHYLARKMSSKMRVETVKPATITDIDELSSATTKRRSQDILRNLAISALAAKGRTATFAARERQSYVIPGFGYLLYDIFQNDVDFDMGKVKIDKNREDSKYMKKRMGSQSRKKGPMSPTRLRD